MGGKRTDGRLDGGLEAVAMGDAVSRAFELVTQLAERDPETGDRRRRLWISTGFDNVDRHTGGLWPGELTVVTGAPGVGKSAFASNLAVWAAKRGARVLFVTLGADATSAVIRMFAAEGRMRARDLLTGHLSQDDWGYMAEAANRLSELDLFICDDPFLTPEGLLSISQDIAAGAERALVVVDGAEYLRVSGEDRVLDWPHTAGASAVFLKGLARAINAPVVETLSYGPGRRRAIHGYEDVLAVLPPGAESAADSVLHIDRRLAGGERDGFPSNDVAKVTIAKSRMCAPAVDKLAFAPERMRFMDLVDDPRTAD